MATHSSSSKSSHEEQWLRKLIKDNREKFFEHTKQLLYRITHHHLYHTLFLERKKQNIHPTFYWRIETRNFQEEYFNQTITITCRRHSSVISRLRSLTRWAVREYIHATLAWIVEKASIPLNESDVECFWKFSSAIYCSLISVFLVTQYLKNRTRMGQ